MSSLYSLKIFLKNLVTDASNDKVTGLKLSPVCMLYGTSFRAESVVFAFNCREICQCSL